MLIHQVDIKEFRGIKKCKEPIKLSKFNVLIGRNNSGKSTILGALSLLPSPFLKEPSGSDRLLFLSNLLGGRSSLIYGYWGEAELNFKINENSWKISIRDTGSIGLSINNETTDPMSPANIASKLNLKNIQRVEKLIFFIPNSSGFIKMLIENLLKDANWSFVMKEGAHFRVANQISECVDDKYTEILISKNTLCARKEFPKKGPFYIKLEDLGDGIEKAIAVMLFVEAFRPDVILWDDFEAAAHPTLIRMLLNWLSKGRWQVVLSTHSIDVLDRLLEVRPKDAQIIQLKKTEDDILLQEKLSLEELEDIMEANQDPRLLVDALHL